MSLTFLGGDTGSGGSPRLYRLGEDYLVQGYAVTEAELLAELNMPPGEAAVRVPRSIWKYLPVRSEDEDMEEALVMRHLGVLDPAEKGDELPVRPERD